MGLHFASFMPGKHGGTSDVPGPNLGFASPKGCLLRNISVLSKCYVTGVTAS